MTQRMTARLTLCALALALAACSLAGPAPRSFVPAKPGEAKLESEAKDPKAKDHEAKDPKAKGHTKDAKAKGAAAKAGQTPLEAASEACKTTARDKGIKSLLSIVTHMRPGAVDADYVACMKEKGYEVAK
jgi:hypothetical protein